MVLPPATHKDTSCWSHKADPVFPLGHNCSGLMCSHKEFTVWSVHPLWSQHQLSYDWTEHVAGSQGKWMYVCLHACELDPSMFSMCACVFENMSAEVGHVAFYSKGWRGLVKIWHLHCAVWASLGCLRPCGKSLWRCRGRFHHLEKIGEEEDMSLKVVLQLLQA